MSNKEQYDELHAIIENSMMAVNNQVVGIGTAAHHILEEGYTKVDAECLTTLEQVADIVTDLLFCNDYNEKEFCKEVLCRKLKKLGYVRKEDKYWYATDKSIYYKTFVNEEE